MCHIQGTLISSARLFWGGPFLTSYCTINISSKNLTLTLKSFDCVTTCHAVEISVTYVSYPPIRTCQFRETLRFVDYSQITVCMKKIWCMPCRAWMYDIATLVWCENVKYWSHNVDFTIMLILTELPCKMLKREKTVTVFHFINIGAELREIITLTLHVPTSSLVSELSNDRVCFCSNEP